MKKLLLILAFGAYTSQLHSQILISLLFGDKLNSDKVDFGLDGGANLSKISGFESKEFSTTFNLGFYFDFKLKESQWNFRTGVMVKSNRGVSGLTTNDLLKIDSSFQFDGEGSYKQVLSYFDVPLLLKYRFKNHFYLEGGGQLSLLSKSYVAYEFTEDDRTELIKTTNTSLVRRIDAGLLVGTGYRLKKGTGMTIGFWYYKGLANVYKGMSGTTNSALTFKLMVPIGAGKAKRNAEAKIQQKELDELRKYKADNEAKIKE
jgi:hypothetical protein